MKEVMEKILQNYDFNGIMELVGRSFGAERLLVRVPVNEGSEIFKTIYDSHEEGGTEKRDVLSAYYLPHDVPVYISDFKREIFTKSDVIDSRTKGILIVPIRFSGRVLGVMYMVFYSDIENERIFGKIEEALPLLGLLVAYRLKELELAESALLDRLTNLPSSTYFWKRLDEEYRRAKRYSRKFALMLIHIDKLKEIEEKYGPRTRDELLRMFAEFAKKHFRRTDIVTRFGGDEFTVILPETGLQNIYQVSESFRLRVMSTPFNIEFGPKLSITVSISVVGYPAIFEEPDVLVEKLLDGIKVAKREGGNRTVLVKQ